MRKLLFTVLLCAAWMSVAAHGQDGNQQSKPKICAAIPAVRLGSTDVPSATQQQLQVALVRLLNGDFSPFEPVPLKSELESEQPKEIAVRQCRYLLRWSVSREGGEGEVGLVGLEKMGAAAQQAASLGGVLSSTTGSPKVGTAVSAGVQIIGAVLGRKTKRKFEITLRYELVPIGDGLTATQEFKATGQAADENVLTPLLKKVANAIESKFVGPK